MNILPIPLEYRILLMMEEKQKMTYEEIRENLDMDEYVEEDVKSTLVQLEWESKIYEVFPGEYKYCIPEEN